LKQARRPSAGLHHIVVYGTDRSFTHQHGHILYTLGHGGITVPWKETDVMKEKVLFVLAYEEGEASIAELCRQFGISRPTGYL